MPPGASVGRSPTALAAQGASLDLSGRNAGGAGGPGGGAARRAATERWSPTSPSRAPPSSSPPRRGEVDILVANAGLPGAGWLADFTAEELGRALRVNLEAPMLLAQALFPAMIERGCGPARLRLLAVGQGGQPAQLDLQRDQVRAARLCPRPAHRPRPAGGRRLARLAGLHPRCRDVRRLRRQAAARVGDRDARSRWPRPWSGRSSTTRSSWPSRPCASGRWPISACSAPASRCAPRAARPGSGRLRPSPPGTPRTSGRQCRCRLPSAVHRSVGRRWRRLCGFGPNVGLRDEQQRFIWRPFDPRGGRARAMRCSASTHWPERFDVARLPYSIKVLLENVLRLEDGVSVSAADVEAIAAWDAGAEPSVEIPFQPARVLMQDFTGVPAVVDLAAMRDAMEEIGGDPAAINPLVDVDLVIDHSVQVDAFGNARRLRGQRRARVRAQPRALLVPQVGTALLRQLQRRAAGDRDLPPGQPRAHRPGRLQQRGRRRSARLPRHAGRHRLAHDDGQRARRARLGRGRDRGRGGDARASRSRCCCRRWSASGSSGELPEGATATDLVLTVTEMLRERGVVSKFVEFFGPGLPTPGARRPGDDRQHVAGVRLDLRDLPGRRRDPALPGADRAPDGDDRAGRRLRPRAGDVPRRGIHRARSSPTQLELDLGEVVPSIAGPKRPQDRVPLDRGKGVLPRGDAWSSTPRPPSSSATGATRRSKSPSRPPIRRPRITTMSAASRGRR